MQIKAVHPINFLFFRTRTKVSELGRYVGIVARELYRDASVNDLEVTGPIYWNYIGFEGDESREFILEIGLPIAEIPVHYEGKYRVKREETFYCLALVHEGSWFDIPATYSRLLHFVTENKVRTALLNREVYVNTDFNNPMANVTEIQVGISADSYSQLKKRQKVSDAAPGVRIEV
jgi:effector-binding domain-containing protein